jgi:hypothetical protein
MRDDDQVEGSIRVSVILRLGTGALLLVLASACVSGPGSGEASPDAPATQETQADASVPTLVILSPRTGETVTPPVPIRYRVTGIDIHRGSSYVQLYLGKPGSSPMIEYPLTHASGIVFLKAHPMLSGRRTLTFELALADHQPLRNPEARVTLQDVIVEGDRGAGG